MPTNQTFTFPVSQAAYDDGVRIHYCTFCPNVVAGDTDGNILKCLSCLAIDGEYKSMEVATYDEANEQFMWAKFNGGSVFEPPVVEPWVNPEPEEGQ